MNQNAKHGWEEDLEKDICDIARELVRGRVGFLFGAGMSVPSGGVPGAKLAYNLIRRGYYPNRQEPFDAEFETALQSAATSYPLEAIAAGVVDALPFKEADLRELLAKFAFPDGAPAIHDGHKKLASIIYRLGSPRIVFTTNWDHLIEDAVGAQSISLTPANISNHIYRIDELLAEKVVVAHLHGTFDQEPKVQERDLMAPDGPLFQLFLSDMMTKSFVFVGYSLSDPNIRALYYKVAGLLTTRSKTLGKITYVVFPPRSEVERAVSTRTWEARNAKYVPLGAGAFFGKLQLAIETQALAQIRQELLARLNASPQQLDQRIAAIQKVFPDFQTAETVLLYLYAITSRGR